MAKPRLIRRTKRVLESYYDLDGSLKSLKEMVDGWVEMYGEDATLDMSRLDYYGDYFIIGDVTYEDLETPEEVKKRLANAKSAREKKKKERVEAEEREHQTYLKLKEKYGEH